MSELGRFLWEIVLIVALVGFVGLTFLRVETTRKHENQWSHSVTEVHGLGDRISIAIQGKAHFQRGGEKAGQPHGFYGVKGTSTMEPTFTLFNKGEKARRVFILAQSNKRTILEYNLLLDARKDFRYRTRASITGSAKLVCYLTIIHRRDK